MFMFLTCFSIRIIISISYIQSILVKKFFHIRAERKILSNVTNFEVKPKIDNFLKISVFCIKMLPKMDFLTKNGFFAQKRQSSSMICSFSHH